MPYSSNYFIFCFNGLLKFLTDEEKRKNKVVLDEMVRDKYNYCLYHEPNFNYTLDKFLEYLNYPSYTSQKIENINEFMQYIQENIDKQYELKINRYNLSNALTISRDTEKAYYLSNDHNSYIRVSHLPDSTTYHLLTHHIDVRYLRYDIRDIKTEGAEGDGPVNVSFRLLVTF